VGEAAFPNAQAAARSRRRAMLVLISLGLAAVLGIGLRVAGASPSVHAYYLPSEGMMPTLAKGDHIIAATGVTAPFSRGEVILFRTARGETYSKRLAGLPGDRIALAGGKVVLNGKAVPQQPLGTAAGSCAPSGSAQPTQRLGERFPWEALRTKSRIAAHRSWTISPSGRSPPATSSCSATIATTPPTAVSRRSSAACRKYPSPTSPDARRSTPSPAVADSDRPCAERPRRGWPNGTREFS
jgi:signal peptidase I